MKTKTNKDNSLPVLATGDVVLDRQVYAGDRLHPASPGKVAPYLTETIGGAKMLHSILEACLGEDNAVFGLEVTANALLEQNLTAFTLLKPCAGGIGEITKDTVWRVEKSLGYSLAGQTNFPHKKSAAADQLCSVLVMDDADLGFRTHHGRAVWPTALAGDAATKLKWVLLKMGKPLCEGDLWRHLCSRNEPMQRIRKKLVVVVSADELRRAGAAISKGFSWERTLTELCRELGNHPRLNALLKSAPYLVVNFGHEASVWFGPDTGGAETATGSAEDVAVTATLATAARAHVIYDPACAEDGWQSCLADNDVKNPHPVYGHLNTIVAALTVQLHLLSDENPTAAFRRGLERGLTAARELRLLGHGKVSEKAPAFPYQELAAIIHPDSAAEAEENSEKAAEARHQAPACGYSLANLGEVSLEQETLDSWTLAAAREDSRLPLYGLAHRVALFGDSALACIPHAHFGKMLSVDRTEIETLCSLRGMITAYNKQPQQEKPLSLAAFGPPGAGKSFGIKQIAKEVLGSKIPILEFNLSQYNDPAELIGAFHLVRNQALKGITPVVFWDEFDAKGYLWLQYLLAPMQDGAFQDNGHIHPIGKSVFVFAGATSWDFEHFGPAPSPRPGDAEARNALQERYKENPDLKKAEEEAEADFRRKKGPDFMSRLDGHIDVLGPNQRMLYCWRERTWVTPDTADITFPVRRALLLRSFLDSVKGNLAIDRDLLRAFLQVPRYRHGARSLEKIAKPLAKTGKPFQRALLPPPQVLEQHLDTAPDFDALYHANRDFLTEENLQKMAAAIDENYLRHDKKNHPKRKPLSQNQFVEEFDKKLVSADPWQQWLAATNIAAARRLPEILSLVGLRLEKGTATPGELKKVSAYLSHHLDVLAKEEHDQWMAFHLANGWCQAEEGCLAELQRLKADDEKTNQKRKSEEKTKPADTHCEEVQRLNKEERIHTLLVPFKDLNNHEKSKDHDAITNYPETVSLVGWKILFA